MDTPHRMDHESRLAHVNALPAVDEDALHKLTGGNTRLAQELLDMLLTELPAHRKRIHEAYHQAEMDVLAVQAHTLRGAAAYCAATALQRASETLEQASRAKDYEAVGEALAMFWQQAERLLESRAIFRGA